MALLPARVPGRPPADLYAGVKKRPLRVREWETLWRKPGLLCRGQGSQGSHLPEPRTGLTLKCPGGLLDDFSTLDKV